MQEQVNKLISIRPLKNRYNGEIGDVVIGRITEVQQKRWKVETNSRLDSVLLLSSVNLPGGELVGVPKFELMLEMLLCDWLRVPFNNLDAIISSPFVLWNLPISAYLLKYKLPTALQQTSYRHYFFY